MALLQNMVSSLVLRTSIASRTLEGTSFMPWTMPQQRLVQALDHFFGPLYDIEEECKSLQLDFDGITEKRKGESLPILQEFRQWMEATLPQTIPKTPIYKAINYALKNNKGLVAYVNDGMCQSTITNWKVRSALSR